MRTLDNLSSLALIALSALSLSMPAFADPSASNAQADTSTSIQSQVGCQPQAAQPRHLGKFAAIKQLPSLTADQSKQLAGILQSFKENIKPLKQEAKALKQKLNEGGDDKDKDKTQARLTELRGEVRAKTRETFQKALALLTPEQKQQLKQMRQARRSSGQEAQPAAGTDSPKPAPDNQSDKPIPDNQSDNMPASQSDNG